MVILRRIAAILAIVLLLTIPVLAAQEKHAYKPENGYVSDEATAIKIAEAVLIPIYGKEVIDGEKPLKASLKNEVWTVEGTLHADKGGVAVIEISKNDGTILRVSHGK